jgi:hypothetical protein
MIASMKEAHKNEVEMLNQQLKESQETQTKLLSQSQLKLQTEIEKERSIKEELE